MADQNRKPAGRALEWVQDLADILSHRVRRGPAADAICVSHERLTELIRDGEIPEIQPAVGRRPGLIEVRALEHYMDRERVRAQQEATERGKSRPARGDGK